MKDFNFVACGKYFVVMDGKLQEVYLYSVYIYPDGGELWYYVRSNSYSVNLPVDTKFYDTEEDFFKNEETKNRCNINSRSAAQIMNCNVANNGNFKGWTLGGTLEEIEFKVQRFIVRPNEYAYDCVDIRRNRMVEGNIYRTRQELLDNSIVKVIDESGNEKEVVGINIKAKLEEDQQQLADQLKELVGKMRESGMILAYNKETAHLSAVNTRNLGKYETYCYNCGGEFEQELYNDGLTDIVDIDAEVDCDCFIGVNRIE